MKIKLPNGLNSNKKYKVSQRKSIARKLGNYIKKCCQEDRLPTFEEFSLNIGIPRTTLNEFKELDAYRETITTIIKDTTLRYLIAEEDKNARGHIFLLQRLDAQEGKQSGIPPVKLIIGNV